MKDGGLKIEGYQKEYNYIKENYSEELANLYNNVPGDTTCDGQRRAHLSEITLIGYNKKAEKFTSYV